MINRYKLLNRIFKFNLNIYGSRFLNWLKTIFSNLSPNSSGSCSGCNCLVISISTLHKIKFEINYNTHYF